MDKIRKRNLSVGVICLGLAVIGYANSGNNVWFYFVGLLAMVFAILFLLMALNKQSRFVVDVKTEKMPEEVLENVENYLVKELKFKLKDYKGTLVYQKGDGFWLQKKCVLVDTSQNQLVHIEAWVSAIWQNENDFTGYVGTFPKKRLKKQVERLMARIE